MCDLCLESLSLYMRYKVGLKSHRRAVEWFMYDVRFYLGTN